jgi:type IV secretory pathway VirB2 component (pilin)
MQSIITQRIYYYRFEIILSIALILLMMEPAMASATTNMPWEAPLKKIANSLTGPTAMVFSIIGVFGTVGALVFGGELNDLIRRLVIIVLVISVLVSCSSFLTLLFGGASAMVAVL